MFICQLNPTTKLVEWVKEKDDYAFEKELASSGYADMLHDQQRNEYYYEAIRRASRDHFNQDEEIQVLDIGTGTGLLAMMVAKTLPKSEVVACELFKPMADIAAKVIQSNNLSDQITVYKKKSTEMRLKTNFKNKRAQFVVNEIVDSVLLGEGILPSLRDANSRLLTKHAVRIPYKATIYGQVISSKILWNCHKIPTFANIDFPSDRPCYGQPQASEIQIDQLVDLKTISEPFKVFEFDLNNIPASDISTIHENYKVRITDDGEGHAILYWFDMHLYDDIKISTNPFAEHAQKTWRDHWMQCINFFPSVYSGNKGDFITIDCFHDDYSVWFRLFELEKIKDVVNNGDFKDHFKEDFFERPFCRCEIHNSWGPGRISELNDLDRLTMYEDALQKLTSNSEQPCVNVSDGSLLAFLMHKNDANSTIRKIERSIFTLEDSLLSRRTVDLLLRFVKKAGSEEEDPSISNRSHMEDLKDDCFRPPVTIINKRASEAKPVDFDNQKIQFVVGEPHFNSSIFPWQNLHFWYARYQLQSSLTENVGVMPFSASLQCFPVNFDHLWKSHSPVNEICGFNIKEFAKYIKDDDGETKPQEDSDSNLHMYCLSQYKYKQLSENAETLLQFDFNKEPGDVSGQVEFSFNSRQIDVLHGIVLFMNYNLSKDDPSSVLTFGPSQQHPYRKQAVFMLPDFGELLTIQSVLVSAQFDHIKGAVSIQTSTKQRP